MNEPGRSIATLMTPGGAAAIATVRATGPILAWFLGKHFSKPLAVLSCVHGELRDDCGAVLDDPVVVLHEDGLMADINLHGGPWVVASVLDQLRRSGFEVVEWPIELLDGESILEREMLADLPLARTEQGLRMLLAQPAAWQEFIASAPSSESIRAVLDDMCLWRLLHPPRVAIVGAPNVGKSTLANQLFAQERSITADVPGTTRDWVGEIANIDGLPVQLVDTPGLRETADTIEQAAIERSREVVAKADLVIQVLDATASVPPPAQTDGLIVLNKIDKARPAVGHDLATVATTGQGIDDLRRLIRERLGCVDLKPDQARWWTQRQQEVLRRALTGPSKLKDFTSAAARCPDR